MRRNAITSCFFIFNCVNLLYAQSGDSILFCIGDTIISRQQALETLYLPSDQHKEFSVEEFNKVLNFYLTIHDFRVQKSDTTLVFKRKLEAQMLNVLGNIYSAENYDDIMNKCTVSQKIFAIVKDLFVPFDPLLLRSIERLKEERVLSFDDLAKYATAYEGTYLGTRIIAPSETAWTLNRAACELLDGEQEQPFIGPIKDMKGYHYLSLMREQANFGRYKVRMIYVNAVEGQGEKKIKEAYKEIKDGVAFEQVARKYSEVYRDEEDGAVVYFSPSINTNQQLENQLSKLTKNSAISAPFFAAGGWYIIQRLNKEEYPSVKELKGQAFEAIRRPSFFMEELKEKYNAEEYPYHFLSGKDEILFLVGKHPYYTSDLNKYAEEYGYDITTETYDSFFNHLLVQEYQKELEAERYKRLVDDFYFMQIRNPLLIYKKGIDKNTFLNDLRELVAKYKPVIPNKKYVENNPVFKN